MRISDWSSDVCSSDLRLVTIFDTNDKKILYSEHKPGVTNLLSKEESQESLQLAINAWKTRSKQIGRASCKGKSVSVRVDLGGRRIIKKKKTNYTQHKVREKSKKQQKKT